MTPRARVLLGVLIGLLVVVLTVAGVRFAFEPVDEVEERGFHGAAAADRLLALQRLLEEMGVPVRRPEGFARLPPRDHVLLVSAPRRSLGPEGAARLLDWAAAGGHLVIVPTPRDLGDPLLQPLGIVVAERPEDPDELPRPRRKKPAPGITPERNPDEVPDPDQAPDPDADPEPDPDPDPDSDSDSAPAPLAWLRGLLDDDQPPPRLLHVGDTDPLLFETREDGLTRIALAWGDGRVTVLADARPLTNERLGRAGNARLAWSTLVPDSRPAGAWLIDRDRRPSPWALLAGRAAPATAALLLLAAAWAWKAAARFGPLLRPPEPERRSLAEHLRASGEWLWSRGASRALIDALRSALHERLARGQDEPLDELALRAAEEHGLDERSVRAALAVHSTAERQTLVRVVRVLETLRRNPR